MICTGCILAQQRTLLIRTNVTYPIAGSEEEEHEFREIDESAWTLLCPFCNAKDVAKNDTELLTSLLERIDNYKDPEAMNLLGSCYRKRETGLPQKPKKAEELHKRAYALGNPIAAYRLAWLHRTILVDDEPAPFPNEVRMMNSLDRRRSATRQCCL